MDRITRRRFFKALGAGGLAYAVGRTPGTAWAQASSVNGGFNDYKALVCLFLFGGNDSWNTVVPRSPGSYDTYASARNALAVPRDALLSIDADNAEAGAYGFHPVMGGLRDLFQAGHCAVVASIGPLIEPVTKEQYNAKTVRIPPQLFSHNNQQDQWNTLRGRTSLATGWAGRVADLLAGQGSGSLPLNISLAGNTRFQAADGPTPLVMGPAGTVKFVGQGAKGRALTRRNAFISVAQDDYDSIFARSYAEVQRRALSYAEVVSAALANAPAISTPFPVNSNLATQLRTVAGLIAARESLGASRQIFFVGAGGFDTHSGQIVDQPLLLGDVSSSLSAFYQATVELGVASSVTTFTQSDFGRSLTSNGDGSDHAWSGVQFVVGGSVQGRRIVGSYPELQMGGPLDIGAGRLIPTISSDQYTATLVRWFGLQEQDMDFIAPSLPNFEVKDLGLFT